VLYQTYELAFSFPVLSFFFIRNLPSDHIPDDYGQLAVAEMAKAGLTRNPKLCVHRGVAAQGILLSQLADLD
jgi:hypothetical protein